MKNCCIKDFCKYIPLAAVIILAVAGAAALKLALLEKIFGQSECCECKD